MAGPTTSSVTVNDLNDDCILYIFNILSTPETIKIERVCKRWQRVLKMMRWKNVLVNVRLGDNFMEKILDKCRNIVINLSIRRLNFRAPKDYNFKDVEEHINLIDAKCKNLIHLYIKYEHFNMKVLNLKRYPFLKKLKSLTVLQEINQVEDEINSKIIMTLFDEAKHLEKFRFEIPMCTEMTIDHCRKQMELVREVDGLDYGKIFKRFPEITHLTLNFYDPINDVLDHYSNQLNLLELIYLPTQWDFSDEKLEFKNLKKLIFESPRSVYDEFVLKFIRKCPSLVEFYWNDDNGFINGCTFYRQLGNLKQLNVLTLRGKKLTSDDIKYLAVNCIQLEEIYCSGMKDLCAPDLENIVVILPRLKYFKIQGFENLTTECFKSVMETVRQRINGSDLVIEFAEEIENDQLAEFNLKEIKTLTKKVEAPKDDFKPWRVRPRTPQLPNGTSIKLLIKLTVKEMKPAEWRDEITPSGGRSPRYIAEHILKTEKFFCVE